MAGDPNAPAAGPVAPPAPSAPNIALNSALPPGVKTMRIKNWDGQTTSILRFKYKTLDDKVITVHLPGAYKTEKMTRDAWDTLFQCFGMDVEAQMEASNRNQLPDISGFIGKYMAEIRGEASNVETGAPNPSGAPMDYARTNLPDIYGGSVTLPPLLPGMP